MAFDGIVIANLRKELSDLLTGGRITKIAQPEPDEIILTVKNQKESYKLLLSANASLPLVYISPENALNPMTAPNFCMLLRKHIGNARITGIRQPGLERILHIDLEHLDEMGDLKHKVLTIEIMGKHSNIIFCDECGNIIDSIKRVSAAVSSVREVLPGRHYFIPNTSSKADPLNTDRIFFENVCSQSKTASAALSGSFTGISLTMARETAFVAGIDDTIPVNMLSDPDKDNFWTAFSDLIKNVNAEHFEPCIAYKDSVPEEFSALALKSFTDCEITYSASISDVIFTYYHKKSRITRLRHKSADMRRSVQTLIERTSKKYDLQLRQLKDTDKRDKYRIYGELLNTYGYDCKKGASSYEALNYYTNENVRIPLDKTLSATENAVKYFDKYNKLKRTYEALTKLTAETKAELDHLESIMTSIDIASDEADLDEIRKELGDCGYMKSSTSSGKKRDMRRKSEPYHYRSSDGFDIYVGKNNYQNEALTFGLARGNDIWMHAKKVPGSHVIIQSNGREIPDSTYEEAGALALYYSKAKSAPKAEVDYIEKKHIKKPAGGKPGFVIYHSNYSLMASPDLSGVTLVSGNEA